MNPIKSILPLLLLAAGALPMRADRFTATTETPVGEQITLTISGSDVTLAGLQGEIVYGQNAPYRVTEQTFSIEGNIEQIYCYYDKITSIDLSECPNLVGLGCQGNRITSVDLTGCASLEILFCDGNPIRRLDVSPCPKLGKLNCSECSLEELVLTGCAELYELSCYTNKLSSLDLSGLSGLLWLYCFENRIETLDVQDCPLLLIVLCNENRLSSLTLSGQSDLQEVRCQGNDIKGADMTALCASLPDRPAEAPGQIFVVDTESQGQDNVCTTDDVALLKGKGWTAYDYQGGANSSMGVEYPGSQGGSVAPAPPADARTQLFMLPGALRLTRVPQGAAVTVCDMSGRTLYHRPLVTDGELTIPAGTWSKGVYLLLVTGAEARLFTLR